MKKKSSPYSERLSAESYIEWGVDQRISFFKSILSLIFQLNELSPYKSSISRLLKDNWEAIWAVALELWLQGYTPNEMVKDKRIGTIIPSVPPQR